MKYDKNKKNNVQKEYSKKYLKTKMLTFKIDKEDNYTISFTINFVYNLNSENFFTVNTLKYKHSIIFLDTKDNYHKNIKKRKQEKYIQILHKFLLQHKRLPTLTELCNSQNLPHPHVLLRVFNNKSIYNIYEEIFNVPTPLKQIEKAIKLISNNKTMFYITIRELEKNTNLSTSQIAYCFIKNKCIAGYYISIYSFSHRGNRTYKFEKIEKRER
jgi:hypothetical protein